jgi:hypothetical protein
MREATVSYNASASTVTIRVEVGDAAYWGEEVSTTFSLGPRCKGRIFDFPEEIEGRIKARPKGDYEAGVKGSATLKGYTGSLEGSGTFDSRHFQLTLSSNAFRNRSWRCASVASEGFLILGHRNFPLNGWSKPKRKHGR